MIELNRRNTVWLVAMAVLTVLGMVAAAGAAGGVGLQMLLFSIFAMAAAASTVKLGKEQETLIDALKRAPVRQRMSPQAKEATERARAQGGFTNNDLMVLDVGLITGQTSYEGMAFRRSRSVSKDDDGARPFVTLNIEEAEAERNATIRFEIYNQYGQEMFVHELRTYLREGEMSIMTDHHLPLAGNDDVTGTGDWDLRVYIDGNLYSMHNFMLAPSMNERQRRLAGDRSDTAASYDIIDEVEQEVPPRLQDLLPEQRQQRQAPSSSGASSSSTASDSSDEGQSRSRRRTGTITRRRR